MTVRKDVFFYVSTHSVSFALLFYPVSTLSNCNLQKVSTLSPDDSVSFALLFYPVSTLSNVTCKKYKLYLQMYKILAYFNMYLK